MFALETALQRILTEGLESVYERHVNIGQHTRKSIRALGLDLFPISDDIASNTCTAIKVPKEVDGAALIKELRETHKIILAGGQSTLSGKIFRIGHMGLTNQEDIDEVVNALSDILPTLYE